jgi:hypothetical protein
MALLKPPTGRLKFPGHPCFYFQVLHCPFFRRHPEERSDEERASIARDEPLFACQLGNIVNSG